MNALIPVERIERMIFLIRGHKVMLDGDLAKLYRVPAKRLNEQVRRNRRRFPDDFMFRLTAAEFAILRSQFATSSQGWGGRRHLPYVFTEQGVAMLSSVLKSERAIDVNVAIMRAFVRLRNILASHKELADKLENVERKLTARLDGHEKVITQLFTEIRELLSPPALPKRRIGFHQGKD